MGRRDRSIAAALAAIAALAYAATAHSDWIFDPLKYGHLIQSGPVSALVRPQHVLGVLLPLAAFRALRAVGYGGGATAVMGFFSVTAAAAATGLVYLAGTLAGGSRRASAAAALVLAATTSVWRAGGSEGVYGVALAMLALAWLAAVRYRVRPHRRTALWLGAAAGLAVGSHLALAAFVPGALALVALVRPDDGTAGPDALRRERMLALALAAVGAALIVFLVGAVVSTGWSLRGLPDWFLHSGIGRATDRSAAVGWGIRGVFSSIGGSSVAERSLPSVVLHHIFAFQVVVGTIVLAVALTSGLRMFRRGRSDRILGAALLSNTALAFLAASWYQALRGDYWGLGLVPLAILAAAGSPERDAVAVSGARRRWIGAAGAVGLAALVAWNLGTEVLPSLAQSRDRSRSVALIVSRIPRGAHVIAPLLLAGRLSDLGYRAEPGLGALTTAVAGGAPAPGVDALVTEASREPVFVARSAFSFLPGQGRTLGATPDGVWRRFERCCLLRPVVRIDAGGGGGGDVLDQLTPRPPSAPASRPSVVLIVTDDQRWDSLDVMPEVRRLLVAHGVTFANGFVVNSLCCPSRTSILTGEYSHSTGVYTDGPPDGGFAGFHGDASTLATWLHDAGYRTGLFGKYLNGYSGVYVPPGWDRWFAFEQNLRYDYYYGYRANDFGRIESFGRDPADYSTDVLAERAVSFIRDTPGPLFMYFAPYGPHVPFTAAPEDMSSFTDLESYRPPNYDEADVSDKPAWVRSLPRLTAKQRRHVDMTRIRQDQTLQAVDRAVGAIVDELLATGRLGHTLIWFTSDNGLSYAEHRWQLRKEAPYEESIRVPDVVRYDPLVRRPSVDRHLVLNVDIAATVAGVAGVSAPAAEGTSVVPLLEGRPVGWRNDFLVEHEATPAVPPGPPTYCAVRSGRYLYVAYATGEEELYDLRADPFELVNRRDDPAMAAVLESRRARVRQLCRPPPPGLRLLGPP